MLENYLLIKKNILPGYFEKVLEARHLIETGEIREVSKAVEKVGISRSTYYKYKDAILEPAEMTGGRNAVLSMMLSHRAGVLSNLLSRISEAGANVLTITQSLPIRGKASVTVSVDISSLNVQLNGFIAALEKAPGVSNLRLVAVE